MNKLMISSFLMLLLTSHAYAFGGGKQKGQHGERGFAKILKQLDLSDDQKQKLKEFRKEKKEDRKSHKGDMKAMHEKMKQAFISGKSEAELKTLHNEIKAQKIEKMDKRFEHMMKIRSVLTQEQRAKFFELQHSMRGKHRGKKGSE